MVESAFASIFRQPSRMNFSLVCSLSHNIIFVTILIIGFICGLIPESTASPLATAQKEITTTYSGVWTAHSRLFSREPHQLSKKYYYETIELSVPMKGTYTFGSKSRINTYGYIYNNNFDPNNPTLNLVSQDDGSDGKKQFMITAFLQPDEKYILVVTPHAPESIGEFSIVLSGPATVSIRSKIESRTVANDTTSTSRPTYSTDYSSALSSSSSIFYRPNGTAGRYYYFHAIQVTVSTDGAYVFKSNSGIDTMGYFYGISFDPSDPTSNLITSDDDSGGSLQFRIQLYLHTNQTYILVVTTHSGSVMGSFSVSAVGPANIGLAAITPSTSRPITTQATTPTFASSYSAALSSNSLIFYRPSGTVGKYYYYQAIQVTVSTTGTYIFKSESSIDTIGYFYGTSFDPSNPTSNLITYDDDSGGLLQFRIQITLHAGQTYILVVTTHSGSVIGNFSVSSVGPANVGLTSIIPSTSRPITTQATTPSSSSSYSSIISSSSPVYHRPNGNIGNSYYFSSIQITVSTTGTYIFKSDSRIDTMGYFYANSFDPSNPSSNLIMFDDDSGGQQQFRIRIFLHVGETYILVVTTHGGSVTGNFSVSSVGPDAVSFTSITPSTSGPIITSTSEPSVESLYSDALLYNGSMYQRPEGQTTLYYYYKDIPLTVSTTGIYTFKSISAFDTIGYLYHNSFNPSNPFLNLVTDDDDSGGQQQFRIRVYLQSGLIYILVVTTHAASITGNFSISAVGPASVSFMSITSPTNPSTTTSFSIPFIISSYANGLMSVSPTFYRPNSDKKNRYYYQAIQINASTVGTYYITCNSFIDTIGYVYDTSFDPLNPMESLITFNGNSDLDSQFRIEVTLESERRYILVVTTCDALNMGVFWIYVRGPAAVDLAPITSTSIATTNNPQYTTIRTDRPPNSTATIKISQITAIGILLLTISTLHVF